MPPERSLEKRREQNRIAQRKHRAKNQELIRFKSELDDKSSKNNRTEIENYGQNSSLSSSSSSSSQEVERDLSNYIQSLLLRSMSPVKSSKICLPKLQLAQSFHTNADRMGIPTSILINYWSISTIQQGWKKRMMITENDEDDQEICPSQNSKTCLTVEEDESISNWRFDRIPENMFPTPAQLSIDHHPYIDCVFPWKSMRTKILLLMENVFTEEELCNETLNSFERYGEQAFTIWGDDPMDESSWEISENFAKNWWFLLDDKIIHRSNWWRRQRDLKELPKIQILD